MMTKEPISPIPPTESLKEFMKEVYNREDIQKIMQGLADHDKRKSDATSLNNLKDSTTSLPTSDAD